MIAADEKSVASVGILSSVSRTAHSNIPTHLPMQQKAQRPVCRTYNSKLAVNDRNRITGPPAAQVDRLG